jgi:hypothetical protein
LSPIPDAAVLDQARREVGLSIDQLWVSYFEIGGKADPLELEAILRGMIEPEPYQYNVIAHALNERFMDRGEDHPVRYVESSRGSPDA